MGKTFQPASVNLVKFSRLSCLLLRILLTHLSVLVFGTTKYLQLLCLCQKQPFTKTAVLCFGKTMLGLPGSFCCPIYICILSQKDIFSQKLQFCILAFDLAHIETSRLFIVNIRHAISYTLFYICVYH